MVTLEQIGAVVAIAVPIILGWRWLFGLEGRLQKHEAECAQFRERLLERHATSTKRADERHEELLTELQAIRAIEVGYFHQRATDGPK